MNVKTRQRLIGFLLLLLLAAILAPLVLRSPEQVRVALDRTIPPPPPTQTPDVAPVITEQDQQAVDDDIDQQQQAIAAAGEEALSQPVKRPEQGDPDGSRPQAGTKTNSHPAPTVEDSPVNKSSDTSPVARSDTKPDQQAALPRAGFTVQVASFSDENNAQALVKRLKDSDYAAYYRSVEQDGNTWQRVFVGPEIKRDAAEALNRKLADDKRFALTPGLVRAFVP